MSQKPETLEVPTDDGRTLEALVSGPADGDVLVFHSGTPVGLVPFPSDLDPAATGIRTVLYARPGYGRSTPAPGRRVADAARDTAAILDALGVERFLNAGWSGGGPHALACDALLPDRCLATAVIAGIAPYAQADAGSDVRSWYEADEDNQLAFAGKVEEFRRSVDGFVANMAEATAEGVATNTPSDADRRFLNQGYAEWAASLFRSSGVSGSSGAADDYLASFQDWGFPLSETRRVTIWHGGEDQNVPLAHGKWLADHLPDADLRVPDEGHLSIVSRLAEIVAELRSRAGSS